MKQLRLLAACTAALALCMLFVHHFALDMRHPMPVSKGARAAQPDSPQADPLFPGLRKDTITAITIASPQQIFQFQRRGPESVSVNGQQADSEIFLTLLEQIAELPADACSAFTPENDTLLLTLIVCEGAKQHTARFYADGAQGEKARIISGSTDAPEYRQTGGWRVGTLMMTCEGTRIQDALGNETPIHP